MSSLTQLLASHDRLLVLDAASIRVQIGLLRAGAPALWRALDEEAGTGIFAGTEAVLKGGRDQAGRCRRVHFLRGSRLDARHAHRRHGLADLVGAQTTPGLCLPESRRRGLLAWSQQARSFAVIADARRDTWHVQSIGADGRLAPLQRIAAPGLPVGGAADSGEFPLMGATAAPRRRLQLRPRADLSHPPAGDLFRATDAPDAFQHEAPEYKKWSAQVHSAATAPSK